MLLRTGYFLLQFSLSIDILCHQTCFSYGLFCHAISGLFLPAVVRPILDSFETAKQVPQPALRDVCIYVLTLLITLTEVFNCLFHFKLYFMFFFSRCFPTRLIPLKFWTKWI